MTHYKFLIFIFKFLFFLFCIIEANSQNKAGITLKGNNYIKINQSDSLFIPGTLHADDNSYFKNWGTLFLGDSLINNTNDTLFESEAYSGILHTTDNDTFFVHGDPVALNHFSNDSSDVIISKSELLIYGNLILSQRLLLWGSINLSSKVFNIIQNNDSVGNKRMRGKLIDETNENYIYSAPDKDGWIESDFVLEDSLKTLGLGIHAHEGSGVHYDITREHHSKEKVTDGSIRKSFSMIPNETVENTSLKMNYYEHDFSGSGAEEEHFKLWHSDDNFFNFDKIIESEVDTENNNVYVLEKGLNIEKDVTKDITISDEICDILPELNMPYDTLFFCEDGFTEITSGANDDYLIQWFNKSGMLPGDSSVLEDVNEQGHYWVWVTDFKACFNSDTVYVIERKKPDPGFNVSNASECLYTPIQFTDTTPAPGCNDSLLYEWTFGDGTVSTEKDPLKQYTDHAVYNITLSVTSDLYGCYDVANYNGLIIHPVPEALFTSEDQCINDSSHFIDNSLIAGDLGDVIWKHLWDFGDGNDTTFENTENFEHVYHQYADTGTYDVSLVVLSSSGCSDTLLSTVQIYPFVSAAFSHESHCQNTPIVFTNSSTPPELLTLSQWNFGDGETSEENSPSHMYDSPGDYPVQLITNTVHNCTDEYTEEITVYPAPITAFSVENTCQTDLVEFENFSTISGNSDLDFYWEFGNGDVSEDGLPIYTYPGYGEFTVKLISISEFSCSDTDSTEISIYPKPTADFFAKNVCLGDTTEFINSSSIPEGSFTNTWIFDEFPFTSSEFEPSVLYNSDGMHSVLLINTSDQNCIDSVQNFIEVDSVPFLDLGGIVSSCTSSVIVDAENPGAFYYWSDGFTGNPHTITTEGEWDVQISFQNSCSFTEYFTVSLNAELSVQLGNDTISCDSIVLDAHYEGSSYEWNTGETTRQISVCTTGFYSVQVTDPNGCIGYDTIHVTVNQSPYVDLGDDIDACENDPVILSADTNFGETILWSTGETSETVSINESGVYWLQLTSQENCSALDMIEIEFFEMPVEPFTQSDTASCYPVVLNALNFGYSYLWSDGSVEKTFTAEQSGFVEVQIYNEACILTDEMNVFIDPVPVVQPEDTTAICANAETTLNAGADADYYLWTNGSENRMILVNEPGIYGVTLTNSLGCNAYREINVGLLPSPVFNFGGTKTICNGVPVILAPSIEADIYEWYQDSILISDDTELEINDPGTYSLYVKNEIGCSFTDTVQVFLNPNSVEADFLIASDIYDRDTVQIIDISLPGFGEYFWNFGDGLSSTETDPLHVWFAPGNYVVTLTIQNDGCFGYLNKDVFVNSRFNKTIEEEEIIISAEKEDKIKTVKLYPNPNHGNFIMETELSEEYDVYLKIYNINGLQLYGSKFSNQSSMTEELSVSEHTAGLYILQIIVEDETRVLKFVKY